jgi:hypothetical protein
MGEFCLLYLLCMLPFPVPPTSLQALQFRAETCVRRRLEASAGSATRGRSLGGSVRAEDIIRVI